MFIEQLLYVRHYSRFWDSALDKAHTSQFSEFPLVRERQTKSKMKESKRHSMLVRTMEKNKPEKRPVGGKETSLSKKNVFLAGGTASAKALY